MNALERESPATTHDGVSWTPRQVLLGVVVLAAALLVSHLGTLAGMVERWAHDPQYSHGFVVPLFALVVLWSRRERLKDFRWQPAWPGAALMGLGLVMRYVAVQSDIDALDAISLLPTTFGLVLLVGGVSVFQWSWPALAFLAFMLPLPFSIEMALSQPLRRIATEVSTYALQTVGCPALAEGNVIYIDDIPLGVEQACSGLGMLMTFFALATAMAMIVRNETLTGTPSPRLAWVYRLMLVGSAIPIAIAANVIRITATGWAYHLAGKDSQLAQMIYHDLAGWLMMPLALGMLWLEMKLLKNLWIEQEVETTLPLMGGGTLPIKGFAAKSVKEVV